MIEISVIIPIFNAEKTLKRCLDSILNQTFKNFEIICVNDGSQDKSIDILKEYKEKDNRIIIIQQENKGVSSARNAGIKIAKGKYITFIDSDDWIEPYTYMSVKQQMNNNYDIIRIEQMKDNLKRKNMEYNQDMIFNSQQIYEEVIPKILNGKIRQFFIIIIY